MPAVAQLRPGEVKQWLDRVSSWDEQQADAEIRRGLPVSLIMAIKQLLDMNDEEAASVIGRSRSTFSRYRKQGKDLGVPEAERAVRFARLVGEAAETFGSLGEAKRWMREPNYALGGETPVHMAETDPGAQIVRDLLVGLKYGFPV